MSSGKEHIEINLSALYVLIPASLLSLFIPGVGLNGLNLLAGYLLSTFLLNPDLDLIKSQPQKNTLGLFWLYSKIVNQRNSKVLSHRGLSHWPIIGTLSRLVYLAGCVCLFDLLLAIFTHTHWVIVGWIITCVKLHSIGAACIGIGLVIGDIIHLLFDLAHSTKKSYSK